MPRGTIGTRVPDVTTYLGAAVLASGGAAPAATMPTTALYLPGTSGEYVSTPDDASLQFTGDHCCVFSGGVSDLTPTPASGLMVAKFNATVTDGEYEFRFGSNNGKPLVRLRESAGSTVTHTTTTWALGDVYSADEQFWLAYTYEDQTSLTFWHSANGVIWTLIEDVGTGVNISLNTHTNPLRIGWDGDTDFFAGSVYYAAVYSGIGANTAPGQGTLVYEADFSHPWVGNRYTDSTGKVSTINGSAWAWEVV